MSPQLRRRFENFHHFGFLVSESTRKRWYTC
jgi:Autoinducer binding domain